MEKVKGSEYFPNALYGKGVVSFLFEVQKQYIIYVYPCTESPYMHIHNVVVLHPPAAILSFCPCCPRGGKEGENAQVSFIPANCMKSAPQFEGLSDYNEDLCEGFPGHR